MLHSRIMCIKIAPHRRSLLRNFKLHLLFAVDIGPNSVIHKIMHHFHFHVVDSKDGNNFALIRQHACISKYAWESSKGGIRQWSPLGSIKPCSNCVLIAPITVSIDEELVYINDILQLGHLYGSSVSNTNICIR